MTDLRVLAMGDNHGDADSLRRVVDATEGMEFDYVVHTGDLTDTSKTDFETGVEQLRSLEPHFEALAARGELVYLYGNRDRERSGTPGRRHVTEGYELGPGRRLRAEETIEVAGQRFTNDPGTAGPEDVLLTHHDRQRLFYGSNARAYFCGHSHRARRVGRSLNTGYLWKADRSPGAYFVVEVGEAGLSVDVRGLAGAWEGSVCPAHTWYGVQFSPVSSGCRICERGLERPFRKMATAAFLDAVESPGHGRSATVEEVVARARTLFVDVDDFGGQMAAYLEGLAGNDAPTDDDPLHPAGGGETALRLPADGHP